MVKILLKTIYFAYKLSDDIQIFKNQLTLCEAYFKYFTHNPTYTDSVSNTLGPARLYRAIGRSLTCGLQSMKRNVSNDHPLDVATETKKHLIVNKKRCPIRQNTYRILLYFHYPLPFNFLIALNRRNFFINYNIKYTKCSCF